MSELAHRVSTHPDGSGAGPDLCEAPPAHSTPLQTMLQTRVARPFQAQATSRRVIVVRAAAPASKGFGAAKPVAVPQTCSCGSKVVYKVGAIGTMKQGRRYRYGDNTVCVSDMIATGAGLCMHGLLSWLGHDLRTHAMVQPRTGLLPAVP